MTDLDNQPSAFGREKEEKDEKLKQEEDRKALKREQEEDRKALKLDRRMTAAAITVGHTVNALRFFFEIIKYLG